MAMTRETATKLVHDTIAQYARQGTKLTIIYVHPLYLEYVEPVAKEYGLHVFSDREAPLDRFLMR